MRIVFVGASALTELTARMVLNKGHDVVIVSNDESALAAYEDSLGCGLVQGDGTRPTVMREVSPKHTDFLFCLGTSDQNNIIAAMVGRALGFERIVTKIDDPDFEQVCAELELQDTIMPEEEVAESLVDLISGQHRAALSAAIRGQVRFFPFKVSEQYDGKRCSDLDLGPHTLAVVVNRHGQDKSEVVDEHIKLHRGDELVLVTHDSELERLHERFGRPEGKG